MRGNRHCYSCHRHQLRLESQCVILFFMFGALALVGFSEHKANRGFFCATFPVR
jgi:hypothetical protein